MTKKSSDESATGGTPVVYRLASDCTLSDVAEGERYHATVNGVVEYGVFVDLSEAVSGLVHESTLEETPEVGDEIIVELTEIRENGDLGFERATIDDPEIVSREHEYERDTVESVADRIGDDVDLEGVVGQVKQTGGPTLFRVRDETGIVQCAAFANAGVRAYPEISRSDAVHVSGQVDSRDGAVQIEVDSLNILPEGPSVDLQDRLEAAMIEGSAPAETDLLVEWAALQKLRPGLERVARHLKTAVLESRPIRIRHHADGDGMCAAVPVERALRAFVAETHEDPEAGRHLLRRLPSKAPYYEMEDATRDLEFALEDRERHGQDLPLLLMLDNGSTEEDTPAYEALDQYDIPILVVDHHHPDPEAVEGLVEEHVNPYLVDEDYRVTTGMLCVELARMIHPEVTEDIEHVPAIAGLADRSTAESMSAYLDLARRAGYDEVFLEDISEAMDYVAHWLRYDAGTRLVDDLLGLDIEDERHRDLVELLADRSRRDASDQVEAVLPHVERTTAENGAHLNLVDLEDYAYRFTYPAPGKTTGAVHDHVVDETGDPVITIGYGPDFAVMRSDGVRLDIPRIVTELNEDLPGAGVSGGGHLVVGSIKFVSGTREEVLDLLVEKMGAAELDADLQVARRT